MTNSTLLLFCFPVFLLITVKCNEDGEAITLSTNEPHSPSPESTDYLIRLVTEAPEPPDYDYSNWTGGPIPAGIYFRISQKGIDYITSLAADALPQLLENSVMPTVDQPEIKISKLTIEKFNKPKIETKFISGKGVGAHLHLPHLTVSAVYEVPTFWSSYQGKFRAEIQNLTIEMEVHISRDESAKENIIEAPLCNVSHDRLRIVFAGDVSTALNLLRSVIERTVTEAVGNELCQLPIRVAHFFEQQKRQILMTTPAPPPTTPTTPIIYELKFGANWGGIPTTTEPPENENAIYETSEEAEQEEPGANFAADLCAYDRMDGGLETVDSADAETFTLSAREKELRSPTVDTEQAENTLTRGGELQTQELWQKPKSVGQTTPASSQRFNPLLLEGNWAPDLTLMYAPKFTDHDMVFGLDGGIVFFGQKAKRVRRPHMLNISALGDQMFGMLISEYVPNTFFAHIYDNQLGTIREVFPTNSLPKFIKPIAKLLCSKCALQLTANLTGKPKMKIDKSGVMLDIEGEVSILFIGKSRNHTVVNAETKLDVLVKPFLKYSRVYGDVALTSVDIKMKDMGVRGMFANSLKKALNAIVPRKLWPKIKKRLRFAFNQRGIKLPVMCGLELLKPSMSYIPHAIVIDTDFSYDLPRFVKKFKAYIKAEVERAKKRQQLASDEEYEGMRYL